MNLIFKDICPVCMTELLGSDTYNSGRGQDFHCMNKCYILYDYGHIQDIIINLKNYCHITYCIYNDTNEYETWVTAKSGKPAFKVNYLIPFEWNNLDKLEQRLNKLIVFS